MRSELRLPAFCSAFALLAAALGCGELQVELPDDEKDRLAAFVERGGKPEAPPLDFTPGDTTDLPHLDHIGWDAVLSRYVVDGRVDYSGFSASPDAREVLDDYLALLARARPGALVSEAEREAFWINAYNAHTFKYAAEALAARPDFSVSDEDFAFFKTRRHVVAGQLYTLDQIEHGVLRGDMAHEGVAALTEAERAVVAEHHAEVFGAGATDPRIHVGLNCASFSCPKLLDAAYTGAALDEQLNAQAAAFVLDPERGAGPQGISMLFFWFASDFAAVHGSSRGFIEAYRDDASDVSFEDALDYNWTLNGE